VRVTLIHNPAAGDGGQPSGGQLEALIVEAGHNVRYQSVREKGWAKVLKKKVDVVAVAGGDGTVAKVARRMRGSGIPIAVLPTGSANNISRTLGIADLSVIELIPSWSSARCLNFDTGVATGPWGTRHFIEGAGLGFFTSAIGHIQANETMTQLNDTEVKLNYALQLLRERLDKAPATKVTASLDGKSISGDYILLEAMLMQYVGPNLHLAPDSIRDDGLFDVVMVAEADREALRDHLHDSEDGTLWPPEFKTRRGKHLRLEWTGFPVHIDDKVWPVKGKKRPKPQATIELEVEGKTIEFLVPKQLGKPKE
jgi:diacylglycerol kinase (ATP)